jgi:hypothetical protein
MNESLPERYRARPAPAEVAEDAAYVMYCNDLRDAGRPESEIPAIADWRAA